MSYTASAVTCRGDGANTNPTASAPMATASKASSSVVIPQIFTNMTNDTVPVRTCRTARDIAQTRTRRARRAAAGSGAVTSVSPTSTAS
ncbi:unannotated protein [freshwater metagenome]|uniref:Unannotated protein n=1 Tax=freshwater metagenome TaxID=449393 RepID=A0A6J6RMP0_9ZZZZ